MCSKIMIELKNIKKSFAGVQALRGVNLKIERGKVTCLAGENGCGKSTLIKILSGAITADSGEIVIENEIFRSIKPIQAIRKGIQVIYQDFSVFPNMTVAENIALNYQLQKNKKIINWKTIKQIAQQALAQVGVDLNLDDLVETQSVANKQLIAVARALLDNAKLIIMDEPTTALTANEVKRLFDVIRNLQKKDIAILFVNHKLDEMYSIAQEMVILRNGENVAQGPIEIFDRKTFTLAMTGRDINQQVYCPPPIGEKILRVEKLSVRGAFKDVSFEISKGEILGIAGLLGSGRSELGKALFGIIPPSSGKVFVENTQIKLSNPREALKSNIAYVPGDRLSEGLFLNQSIGKNTLVAVLKNFAKAGVLEHKAMDKSMHEWIEKLNIAAPSPYPKVQTLSGGNQQKVVLAKWLATKHKLLILDGPTVGVDIGAKTDIHNILRDIAQKGIGVIIISDDIPELMLNCNRILIMRAGKITNEIQTKDLNNDESELAKQLSFGD